MCMCLCCDIYLNRSNKGTVPVNVQPVKSLLDVLLRELAEFITNMNERIAQSET